MKGSTTVVSISVLPVQRNPNPPILDSTGFPLAPACLVLGRRWGFIYLKECPLCALEHAHGQVPLYRAEDLLSFHRDGRRNGHCGCQGLGRQARFIGGEWRIMHRDCVTGSYRLIPVGPVHFTPKGIREPAAREAMMRLARLSVETSLRTINTRLKWVLERGDDGTPPSREREREIFR